MALNNFVKCKICGRGFMKTGSRSTCPNCAEKEENIFIEMKDYLYQYPDASMAEVSTQLDISEELIDDWIKQGRIELKTSTKKTYSCEMCGNPIHVGKICRKCQQKLSDIKKELNESVKEESEGVDFRNKMYSMDKSRK